MPNVFWEITRMEDEVVVNEQWRRGTGVRPKFIVVFHRQCVSGIAYRKFKWGIEQLKVRSQRHDSCEAEGKFLQQKSEDNDARVQVHVARGTSCIAE